MTPNIGLGGNSGMESVVALTNLLQNAIHPEQDAASPARKLDFPALQGILTTYQTERQARMRKIIDFSGLATKTQAWETLGHKLMSRIVPFLPDDTFAKQATALFKGAPSLNFVPVPGKYRGTVSWDDETTTLRPSMRTPVREQNLRLSWSSKPKKASYWFTTPMLGFGIALMSLFLFVQGAKV